MARSQFELGFIPPVDMEYVRSGSNSSSSREQGSNGVNGWQIGYFGINWRLSRWVGFSARASPTHSYRASQSVEEQLKCKPSWEQPVVQIGPSLWIGPITMDVRYGCVPLLSETGVRWHRLERKVFVTYTALACLWYRELQQLVS